MPILCTLVLGVVWWVLVVGYGHVTSMTEKNRENPTAPATRAEATKRENSLRLAPSSPPPTTLPAPETASIPSQTSEFYSGFLWWELAVAPSSILPWGFSSVFILTFHFLGTHFIALYKSTSLW